MNILRNSQGELRRNFAVLGVAGALALGFAESGDQQPANSTKVMAETEKNQFLHTVASKIGKLILCSTPKSSEVTLYDSAVQRSVLVSVQAYDQQHAYEVDAVMALSSSGHPLPNRTQAVRVEQIRPVEANLKIISGTGSESQHWLVNNYFKPNANPYIQYDAQNVGGLIQSSTPHEQMVMATQAWASTQKAVDIIELSDRSSKCE